MQRVSGSYRPMQTGCLALFGLIFFGAGVVSCVLPAVLGGVVSFRNGQFSFEPSNLMDVGATAVCIGVPFTLVGLVIMGAALRTMLARARLGPPEAAVSTTTPRVGEVFTLTYQQTFRAATEVEAVRMDLILQESATYRRGTDTVTVTHEHIVQHYEQPARQYASGEMFTARREFQIPPLGMHTFVANRNKLAWFVRVNVKLRGWPDYAEEFHLVVPPELAR